MPATATLATAWYCLKCCLVQHGWWCLRGAWGVVVVMLLVQFMPGLVQLEKAFL